VQLRGILSPKVQELAEGRRKIQTLGLRNLYASVIYTIHVTCIGEIKNAHRIYFGKFV
jgi:hypothetical protein